MAAAADHGADPQIARRPPPDLRALRQVAVQALGQDELRRQVADALLDLDVEVVQRQRQAVDGARRIDHAEGDRVCLLWLQFRIAALEEVVLARRRVGDDAPLLAGDAAAGALLEGTALGGHAAFHRPAAGVARHVEQVEALGLEQFAHVGAADGALEAAAQLDVVVDGPAAADAEGVGGHAVVVVRIAVGEVQREFLDARPALHQRHVRLEERLGHLVAAAHRIGGAALAGAFAVAEAFIRVEVHVVVAAFDAEGHRHAGIGRRRRELQIASHVGGDDGLVRGAAGEQRQHDVVQRRLGDAALLEDVPRHAVRVRPVDHGAADDFASLVAHGIERTADLGGAQVVQIGVLHAHFGADEGGVVAPIGVQIAAKAHHAAERRVAQILLSVAALDVAPADPEGVAHVVAGEADAAADGLELVIGEEGVAAVDAAGDEEGTGGRDLRHGAVVHVHQLRVRLHHVVDGVAGEGAEGVLLVRALVVVERAVVEGLALARHEAVALHDVVHERLRAEHRIGRAEVGEAALGNRRAAEAELGAVGEGAGAVVAVALPHRFHVAVGGVGGDVAAAVVQIAAQDQRQIGRLAVGDAAGGGRIASVLHDLAPVASVVVVVVAAVLVVHAEALEVVLHEEVDDAGDRVRTVGGGGAASQHFDAADEGARNLVDVRAAGLQRRADRQPAAVHQHQRAHSAEVA